ncbi:MAG: pilin [Candidatus Pacebacteria bacterium]|nr:pilin [Candidatus Paceibacterota bacterium]MCF7857297.1 pilin [Candidatus Paceibacterota bacterium]
MYTLQRIIVIAFFSFLCLGSVQLSFAQDTGVPTDSIYNHTDPADGAIPQTNQTSVDQQLQAQPSGYDNYYNTDDPGNEGFSTTEAVPNKSPGAFNASKKSPGAYNEAPAGSGKLVNPLESKSIPELLLKIIDVLLVFAIPLIVLYIMYAGYLFVTARGNSEQISTARTALFSAIVGGVIVLGAKLIISVIQGTIQAF